MKTKKVKAARQKHLIVWSHGNMEGNISYDSHSQTLTEDDLTKIREQVAITISEQHGLQSQASAVVIRNIMKM